MKRYRVNEKINFLGVLILKGNELSIPFDVEILRENLLHKIYRKTIVLVKASIKRVIEIFISLIGIILLIPLSIVVFFQNLKNHDNGKIFYTQNRIGKNGKIFKMYKFRTMVNNADEILEAMLQDEKIKQEYEKYRKFTNDPRLTKFGKVLRATCLDEFPQFINVLKGEMSLVGPRPYLPEEQERMNSYYKYIVQHKPGITGVYQISGRERVEFLDRLDMDMRYHYSRTILLDIKIALITVLVTFRRKKTYDVREMFLDTTHYIGRQLTLLAKRIIDIVGAIVGIAILIPLTAVVWIGNRVCGDKGPIFYTQDRIGKDGKNFRMYKFRSMVVGADEILKELLENDELAREEYSEYKKLKNDPRVTKMGDFLRKTSLDEFPQFINVLKGEMSIVGPRAYLPREKEDMKKYYDVIIGLKPGITGLWQVSGRSSTTFIERMELDLEYKEKQSIAKDIEILFKTVLSVTKKEGAV